ncbi:MAG: bifunctional nuclease domain-containing protein [Bacteroidota bacterium]|nr:bifunctional nuclease domain-containing protein [Bacteroidota bacterium]
MKLIQLDISAIRSSDSQNNAYVLLLNEVTGERQLPIVIGWCEARSIAIALDGSEVTERPLTHDLFKSFAKSYDLTVSKVIIHSLNEGIFYASFYTKDKSDKEQEIDARTSDAIAIAIRFSCPIFTYEDVLKRAGVIIADTTIKKKKGASSKKKKNDGDKSNQMAKYNLRELKKLLKEAIETENYEMASIIRDEIKKREEK